MKFHRLFAGLLALTSLGLLSVACSSTTADAESICEAQKECSGASDTQKNQNCADAAAKQEEEAERVGCSSEYADTVSCMADIDDVCAENAGAGCFGEALSYLSCQQKYCEKNADDKACASGGITVEPDEPEEL